METKVKVSLCVDTVIPTPHKQGGVAGNIGSVCSAETCCLAYALFRFVTLRAANEMEKHTVIVSLMNHYPDELARLYLEPQAQCVSFFCLQENCIASINRLEGKISRLSNS